MSVSRAEQQLAWREDRMKQEVADVQKVSESEVDIIIVLCECFLTEIARS